LHTGKIHHKNIDRIDVDLIDLSPFCQGSRFEDGSRKESQNVELQVERTLEEFSLDKSLDDATLWADEMFLRFVDRVEIWI